jgi:hypothetical protein
MIMCMDWPLYFTEREGVDAWEGNAAIFAIRNLEGNLEIYICFHLFKHSAKHKLPTLVKPRQCM